MSTDFDSWHPSIGVLFAITAAVFVFSVLSGWGAHKIFKGGEKNQKGGSHDEIIMFGFIVGCVGFMVLIYYLTRGHL